MVASLLVPIAQLVLAAVLGAITVYIAWQQWRTNRNQFRLHLFDRRMVIYDAALELASRVAQHGTVTQEELAIFMRKASEASLLFDDEIQAYCQELYKKGVSLNIASKVTEKPSTSFTPPNYEEYARLMGELQTWFSEQIGHKIKSRFEPFLRMRE